MGFFDFLKSSVRCPLCGSTDARKSGERVVCSNPMCRNFPGQEPAAAGGAQPPARAKPSNVPRGQWQPPHPITVRYRNFENLERTYTADAESCRRQKNHISLLVAPTGRRITLRRDRIQNLAEIEAHCAQRVAPDQPWPTPRERQVLNYHKKHKSTSPLYEQIRTKYPDW
jgi:hypothetical protein